jgi:hypothetical protein
MIEKDIHEAWAEIRKTNSTIPDDVLDFMKDSALENLRMPLTAEQRRYIQCRPIIFLDIDGVFNCQLHYHSKQFTDYRDAKKTLKKQVKKKQIERLEYYKAMISLERVEMFNELCKQTNAVVVISSTWRMGKTVEELQEIMDYCGATFEIIDKTGRSDLRERGPEIKKWLSDNIKEETHGCLYFDFYKYAIIDDDSDMMLNQKEHFFQTDNYSGLTPTTCYKIRRFINKKTFQ